MVRCIATKVVHVSPLTTGTCLRNLYSTRSAIVVPSSHQHLPRRFQYSIRPCSAGSWGIHNSKGFLLDVSPSSNQSFSRWYFSTKAATTDVVVPPTSIQHVNDADSATAPPSNTQQSSESTPSSPPLVYESPLGSVISKLRTVSLCTALIGMTGVPCMIALKGGPIPETGILAAALLFVSGSIGSTAAIHFVFSPYVYKIEQIPIRVCSSTNASTITTETTNTDSSNSIDAQNSTATKPIKDTLLKVWTRTLFLRNDSIVFDPTIDVQPYQGLRPMCNFLAKGHPLYVHPGTSTHFYQHI